MTDSRTAARVLAAFLLAIACRAATAGQERTIALADGSVLHGEIVRAQGGTYTIRTATLGTVEIKDADIRSITSTDPAPPAADAASARGAPDAGAATAAATLRERITSDPTLMKSIAALKNDPEVQQVLRDPAIAKAIRDGDYQSLRDNPAIVQLMSNPGVKSIYQQLGQ